MKDHRRALLAFAFVREAERMLEDPRTYERVSDAELRVYVKTARAGYERAVTRRRPKRPGRRQLSLSGCGEGT